MNKLSALFLPLLLLSSLTSAKGDNLPDTPNNTQTRAIMLIDCEEGFGTGFVVADRTVATALHVASMHNCVVSTYTGVRKIKLFLADKRHDFAVMTTNTTGMAKMPYSCVRYKNKQHYYSFGFGDGKPMLQRLIATKSRYNGKAELLGTIIDGQSGGPVVDIKGVAHGINNASDYSWGVSLSTELADTPLCRK